jgi:hypothetical protein
MIVLANELSVAPWEITDKVLLDYLLKNQSFNKLSLKGSVISNTGLAYLATNCPGITHLDLSTSRWGAPGISSIPKITDAGVIHLVTKCLQLQELQLNGCRKITGSCLQQLSNLCCDFCSINLRDTKVKELVERKFLETHGSKLSKYSPRLGNVNASLLDTITATCVNLRELDLDSCECVTDDHLVGIARSLPRITVLTVEGCKLVSDRGVLALAQSPSCLEHLGLGRGMWSNWQNARITEDSAGQIIQHCGRLQVLDLTGCARISASVVWRVLSQLPEERRDGLEVRGMDTLSEDGGKAVQARKHAAKVGRAAQAAAKAAREVSERASILAKEKQKQKFSLSGLDDVLHGLYSSQSNPADGCGWLDKYCGN